MPLSEKRKRADVYVENNGTAEEMFTKTLRFINKIMGLNKKWLFLLLFERRYIAKS